MATASLLSIAVLAGACSTSGDFEQVQEPPRDDGVPMSTTSLVATSLPQLDSTAAPTSTQTVSAEDSDAALTSMIGQLATEPGLIAAVGQLPNAAPATLAAMFGLDEPVMRQLELTLSQLQGIAAMIAGVDPQQLAAAFGSGLGDSIDMSALQGLLAIAERLDAAAIAAVDGLTQQVIRSVVTSIGEAADVVDPALVALFAALLDHFDPAGLGSLGAKQSTASVLAVFTAAVLRANPTLGVRIEPYVRVDPNLGALVERLDDLADTLEPAEASALAAVASQLTPQGLLGLSQLVTVLDAPTTQHLFARLAT